MSRILSFLLIYFHKMYVGQSTTKANITQHPLQSSHAAYYVATQMALAHNGIIRGLNSIYLQATNIPREDLTTVQDFLTYCQCWCESMHHHHDAEEQEFFPNIERISGVQGLMRRNVEQHQEFTPGFDLFQTYAQTCPVKEHDGQKIKNLIEGFAEPLTRHLHDEIDTLRALDKYDSEAVRQAYKRLEKILMDTDNVSSIGIMVILNLVANAAVVSNRPLSIWDRGPEFRGTHT
jgi:hemerythrin-like domain-containing protein